MPTLDETSEAEAQKHTELCSLKNYPQQEFTHEFVAWSIRNAFRAGFKAGVEAAGKAGA